MARAAAGAARALGEEALDDAVFQRMEGDDGEPPLRFQHAFGGFKPAFEFAQLVVHSDAQRLEGARRGMDFLRAAAEHAFDDRRQARACA